MSVERQPQPAAPVAGMHAGVEPHGNTPVSVRTAIGAVVPALLLVGAIVLTGANMHGHPSALALPTGVTAGSMRARAVIVVHPDDCPSNWRFLELLAHPDVKRRLDLAWIASPTESGMERLPAALPPGLSGLPVRALNRSDRRALGSLGYRTGPLLLVFDADARLRVIEPAPVSPQEFVRLGRRLRGTDASVPF